jgi:alpha,alpha-trehalose phosphorylase
MINHPNFVIEDWRARETALDLSVLANTESIFALSNGHIGLRANLDEGEPHGMPGTYLNSFYEVKDLPYPEGGYGYPEAGQSLINVTNGKIIRLLVDDEPFDVRYGQLRRHERVLDLRDGVLQREVEWVSPAGQALRLHTTRLVSFVHRSVAAILYEVEPMDAGASFVVQSELVANEPLPHLRTDDPRAGEKLDDVLISEDFSNHEARATLEHRTRRSGLRMAAAMDHVVDAPAEMTKSCESSEDLGRFTVALDLDPGQRLRLVKLLAYGLSSQRSLTALTDQVEAALVSARHDGWDGLLARQKKYLDDFWDGANIEIEGDPELQLAVRFAYFHVLQAAARAEKRAIPAKGLTGTGYDGHTFWDTETYVLPALIYTQPDAVRDALHWRHATLDLARERAKVLGFKGAAFPWRTIQGQETSGYWPASTAAVHVNADIAQAVIRYVSATDDDAFEREVGLELLVETARFWRSVGHHDAEGRFNINGVTGPDEYSAIADNNVYTNLLAELNLRAAAEAAERHMDKARQLGLDREETASWRDAAASMRIPSDERLGVHPQAQGFTDHDDWGFANTKPEDYPLLLHYPYFDLYRKQVVKQADLVLALHARGDAFTDEEKARNFDYYERLTVRDSSLSSSIQAVIAAEVGHLDLAFDYFAEAALLDLDDIRHNTRDGLHLASLAGAILAAVAGFAGMRDHDASISLMPRLPAALTRISFRFRYKRTCMKVEFDHHQAEYTVIDGDPLELTHYGKALKVSKDGPVTAPIPRLEQRKRPSQPHGREPVPRSEQS